jgi:hypothetical protein
LAWVALLTVLPEKVDLHIISDDGDYAGELEKDQIHPYLKFEWEKKKTGGTVKLWKRTSQFLAAHFPDAMNAIEIERTLMIERLEKSPNFAATHSIIAEFTDISHLSHPLATRLASAILNNPQVQWIHDDADVKEFITGFVAKYGANIDAGLRGELEKLVAPPPAPEEPGIL